MSDKRERLVEAAGAVLHANGYEGTTLARVAERASVPLGNVYYYFKTKDELTSAVVDARLAEAQALIARIEAKAGASPLERLRAFVAAYESEGEVLATRGCPYGALSRDLAMHPGPLRARAGALFDAQIAWTAAQFKQLGPGGPKSAARARERATELLCAIQGACVVAVALRDAELLKSRLRAIARRLDAE